MSANKSSVLRFPLRSGDWNQKELSEFYRVENALIQGGLGVYTDSGISDEGDPWFIFIREHDDEPIIHFARIGSEYIIASAAYQHPARGRNFHEMVLDLLSRHRLSFEAITNSKNVLLHPSALLIMFVGIAFFKLSHPAEASETKIYYEKCNSKSSPQLFYNEIKFGAKKLNQSEQSDSYGEINSSQISAILLAIINYFSDPSYADDAQFISGSLNQQQNIQNLNIAYPPTSEITFVNRLINIRETYDTNSFGQETPPFIWTGATHTLPLFFEEYKKQVNSLSEIVASKNNISDNTTTENSGKLHLFNLTSHTTWNSISGMPSLLAHQNAADAIYNIISKVSAPQSRTSIPTSINLDEATKPTNEFAPRDGGVYSSNFDLKAWPVFSDNFASEIISLFKLNIDNFINEPVVGTVDGANNYLPVKPYVADFNDRANFTDVRTTTNETPSIKIGVGNSTDNNAGPKFAIVSLVYTDRTAKINEPYIAFDSYDVGKKQHLNDHIFILLDKLTTDQPLGFKTDDNMISFEQLTNKFQYHTESINHKLQVNNSYEYDIELWTSTTAINLLDRFLSKTNDFILSAPTENGFIFQTKLSLTPGLNGKISIDFHDGSYIDIIGQKNEIINLLDF